MMKDMKSEKEWLKLGYRLVRGKGGTYFERVSEWDEITEVDPKPVVNSIRTRKHGIRQIVGLYLTLFLLVCVLFGWRW